MVLRQLSSLARHLFSNGPSGSIPSSTGPNTSSSSSKPRTLLSRLYAWPPPPLDPSRQTAWLDGLRGIAAWLVVVYHYNLNMWPLLLEAPYGSYIEGEAEEKRLERLWQIWRLPVLRVFMCGGHAQVSVFFVLSGFVLAWSPLGAIGRGQGERVATSLASATFRRWLRLYLPCFVIGLVSLFEVRWGFIDYIGGLKSNAFLQLWDYLFAFERFSDPLWINRPADKYRLDYNWTMWTIPHEFGGSLLVFLLVLSVSRIRNYSRRAIVLGFISVYALIKACWTYWLFSTGVLFADYVRNAGGFVTSTRPWPWVALLSVSLFLAGFPEENSFYTRPGYQWLIDLTPLNWQDVESGGRFWWCWAGILFVVSACHLASVRRILEAPVMRYLGRVSYMLYITHRTLYEVFGIFFWKYTFIPMFTPVFNEVRKLTFYVASPPVAIFAFFAYWAIMAPLAILVAHWCEVFVDGPSVRLAKRVEKMFIDGFETERANTDEELAQLALLREPPPSNSQERID